MVNGAGVEAFLEASHVGVARVDVEFGLGVPGEDFFEVEVCFGIGFGVGVACVDGAVARGVVGGDGGCVCQNGDGGGFGHLHFERLLMYYFRMI